MPIYSTLCGTCEKRDSVWRTIATRDNAIYCPCGGRAFRVIDKPMIQGEITPFNSPTDGRLISSRREWKADLERSNARPWEPGIEKDIARRGEALREEAFKPISDAVDSIVRDMNVCGKLENVNA